MKRIIGIVCVVATILFFLSSCSRGITPYQAANGKAKCGRYIR